MKKTVLLYNFSQERSRELYPLCLRAGARIKKVSRQEYSQTIGALVGRPVAASSAADPKETACDTFNDEMMVMDGFTRKDLDTFLNSFRRNNVKPVALKAVVTAVNSLWDSQTLYNEIRSEHEAMQKQ